MQLEATPSSPIASYIGLFHKNIAENNIMLKVYNHGAALLAVPGCMWPTGCVGCAWYRRRHGCCVHSVVASRGERPSLRALRYLIRVHGEVLADASIIARAVISKSSSYSICLRT